MSKTSLTSAIPINSQLYGNINFSQSFREGSYNFYLLYLHKTFFSLIENRQITQNGQPRQQTFAQKPGGENREERNNRKNRELNGQVTNGMEQSDKPRGNNNTTKPPRNDRKNFNGKRRDRQSGSDKTGVKSVDKRGGEGAHNWGTHKTDIDDMNKPVTDGEDTSGEKEVEEVEEQPPAPEVS